MYLTKNKSEILVFYQDYRHQLNLAIQNSEAYIYGHRDRVHFISFNLIFSINPIHSYYFLHPIKYETFIFQHKILYNEGKKVKIMIFLF